MPKFDLPYANAVSSDKKILYKNARIIDPKSNYDEVGELLTIGDKIVDFGKNLNVKADEEIDCKGLVLAPGLIDIQVHLIYHFRY